MRVGCKASILEKAICNQNTNYPHTQPHPKKKSKSSHYPNKRKSLRNDLLSAREEFQLHEDSSISFSPNTLKDHMR